AFQLYKTEQGYRLLIEDGDERLATAPFSLSGNVPTDLNLEVIGGIDGEVEPIKTIIGYRTELSGIDLHFPDGEDIRMSGLRKFAAVKPLYTLQDDGETLTNNQSGQVLRPNMEIGFYQPINESGEFVGERVSPGFVVSIGTHNFERVWKDEGIKEPFINIFIWTVIFSVLTVIFTLMIGLVLASVVQWEALKGRAVYRVLLILPYAVPAFISILIFRGLFNQSFGEINMVLNGLFGLSPAWFSDPLLAKTMVLIVNTWLGFPYMMILCMGLLKAIPDDLYEASAIDGANFIHNFTKITLPMMIKPLTPLLIASFAFNFNNFVMIQLLTQGGPNRIGTSEPAGYTDLLVSYTYRIAFEGTGGQDFGLASAIATLIFLLVGALALLNLRFTKLSQQ
ncbi:maltose ABC transporter permease MalF, partial [Vibrio cholerae]